ncbi:hypothetical protein RUND412_002340 [Rhizina undulata]
MLRAILIKPFAAALPKALVFSGGLLLTNRAVLCLAVAARLSVNNGGICPRTVFTTSLSRGFATGTNSSITQAFLSTANSSTQNNNANGHSNINASTIVIPAGTIPKDPNEIKPWTPAQAVMLEPQTAESNKQIFHVKNWIHQIQGNERSSGSFVSLLISFLSLFTRTIWVIVKIIWWNGKISALILPNFAFLMMYTWHQLEKLPELLDEIILEKAAEEDTKEVKADKKEDGKKGKNGPN